MRKNRALKKHILKLRYLEEEHGEALEIYNDAQREFEIAIRKMHSDLNVFDKSLDCQFQQAKQDQDDNPAACEQDMAIEKKNDTPQWAKKIFRKIAMITHPDKIPTGLDESIAKRLSKMYQKAQDSISQNEYTDLVMVASDLDVDLQKIDIDNFDFFRDKEKALKAKIKEIKTSVFWMWAHSTDDQKEKIMQEFIRSRGWTSSKNLRKRSRSGVGKHPGKSLSWARNIKKK